MAKEGESLIDEHNEANSELDRFIRLEIEKRKTLLKQLAMIDELLALTNPEIECDEPLIVEVNSGIS